MSASSHLNDKSSPEQQVPSVSLPVTATTSATMLPTAAPRPCFSFRPVRHSIDTHGTDSEASDITESTDISEQTEGPCCSETSPGVSFTSSAKPAQPPV